MRQLLLAAFAACLFAFGMPMVAVQAADIQQTYDICADQGFLAAANQHDLEVAGCATPKATECPPINMFDAAVMQLRKQLGCMHGIDTGGSIGGGHPGPGPEPCVEEPPPCEPPPCVEPPPCEEPPPPPPCEEEPSPCEDPPPCEQDLGL